MSASVTCTNAVKAADGKVRLTYSDGSQDEFQSLSDAYDAVFDLDNEPAQAKKWLLAGWLKFDPGAANPAAYVNGKTCVVNALSSDPVKFV
jgi:hypothetical protein